jgi:hypothetical protein
VSLSDIRLSKCQVGLMVCDRARSWKTENVPYRRARQASRLQPAGHRRHHPAAHGRHPSCLPGYALPTCSPTHNNC